MGGSPFDTLGFLKAVINMPTWPSAKKYHDRTNPPLMVSPGFALQPVGNTMKDTIDDTDYIINSICLIFKIQQLINSSHSHSIINKPFFSFYKYHVQELLLIATEHYKSLVKMRQALQQVFVDNCDCGETQNTTLRY